jgi:cob(I)alamin adenosyltransferase
MVMRIYTKTGDTGETGLFGGQRVSKDHIRVEAYGAVDELNANLGVARAILADTGLLRLLADLQARLFELGGDLATPPARERRPASINDGDVLWLEQQIDAFEAELPPLKTFVLPAGTPGAAQLHVARTVCRRAERRCVTLSQAEPDTTPLAVMFLNRLADLLFVLTRVANYRAGVDDEPWTART